MLGGNQQWRQIACGGRLLYSAGILVELFQAGPQLALCLQQQGLRVACQFAGGQEIGFAEVVEGGEAGAQALAQLGWQSGELLLQFFDALTGAAKAQGITAGEVVLNVQRHFTLKLLGQAQVTLHQQVRALKRALGPPERRAQSQAHSDEQQGVEIGQQFQAHSRIQSAAECKCLKLLRFCYRVMTESVESDEKVALCLVACTRLRPACFAR